MPVYLTFDIGTTALKTALIDPTGRLLAVHVEEYAFHTPQADWAEMEPEAYWRVAGIGEFESIEEASEAWYRPARVFEPNPELHICYRDIYERYLDLYRRLYN